MKAVWTGTDSLFLVKFPKQLSWYKIFYVLGLRIYARIVDLFVQEHLSNGPLVYDNLERFGLRKRIISFDSPIDEHTYIKRKHKKFNILYYYPIERDSKFTRWLYGKDIYEQIIEIVLTHNNFNQTKMNINFILVDGSQDMSQIYPYADLLIRPNRHDGNPRMVRECILNDIPVIHSYENPDIINFLTEIRKHYDTYCRNKT